MSLPSYNEALEKALRIVQPIASCQTVMLEQALGRVLATDIVADRDLPPYNRSQMDGYAVVASEVSKGVAMKVTSRIAAGSCKAAIKAGDQLTQQELRDLLQKRREIERGSNCPHGRPTTMVLSIEELEQRFGRR